MFEDNPSAWRAFLSGGLVGPAEWSAGDARPALEIPEIVAMVGAPLQRLPWDDHTYMYVGPPRLPLTDRAQLWVVRGIRRWWEEREGDTPRLENALQLPAMRKRLPSRQQFNGYALRAELGEAVGIPSEMSGAWIPARPSDMRALLDPTSDDAKKFWGRVVYDRPLAMYQAWLDAQGIRYITAKELTRHKWRKPWDSKVVKGLDRSAWAPYYHELRLDYLVKMLGGILPEYVVPHPSEWPRILPTIILLDRFRHWLGEPVQVISGYRTAAYNLRPGVRWLANAGPGGATDSRHMSNEAVDFMYRDRDPRPGRDGQLDVRVFLDFYNSLYLNEDSANDGIGVYNTFIHLDRFSRGSRKAKRWNKRTHPDDKRLHHYRGTRDLTTRR